MSTSPSWQLLSSINLEQGQGELLGRMLSSPCLNEPDGNGAPQPRGLEVRLGRSLVGFRPLSPSLGFKCIRALDIDRTGCSGRLACPLPLICPAHLALGEHFPGIGSRRFVLRDLGTGPTFMAGEAETRLY